MAKSALVWSATSSWAARIRTPTGRSRTSSTSIRRRRWSRSAAGTRPAVKAAADAARLGRVRDRLPQAGRAGRHRSGRCLDAGRSATTRSCWPRSPPASTFSARSRSPTRWIEARGDARRGATGAASINDGQFQLPARAGGAARQAADRRRHGSARSATSGRSICRTGSSTPSFPLVWRLQKDLAGSGALGDIAAHIAGSGPLPGRADHRGRRLDGDLHQRTAGRSHSGGGAGLQADRRPGDGPGDCRRRGALPGQIRQRRDGHFRGDPPRARTPQLQRVRDQRLATAAIVFNLERMNELEVYFVDDPAGLQGFRTIIVTDGSIPTPGTGGRPGTSSATSTPSCTPSKT